MRMALRLVILVLLAGALAWALVPSGAWWTGRMAPSPLVLVPGLPGEAPVGRVWIDTDAACGAGPRTDPDDCFAILWLLARGVDVVGISTSFGNAPGAVVAERADALAAQMRQAGLSVPPILAGHAGPVEAPALPEPAGVLALRAALETEPLTVLALGPLTNLAAALEGRPGLAGNVRRLVAVMGHEEGHVFHPSEGRGTGAAVGHGPIFRDLNVSVDPDAVEKVLALKLPLTLIPYDAGRGVLIGAADLAAFARQGPAQDWVAGQARDWLEFWRQVVGLEGFYPFDWVAAAWLTDPDQFACADVSAGVRLEFAFWIWPRRGLVVEPGQGQRTVYCPQTSSGLHGVLLAP